MAIPTNGIQLVRLAGAAFNQQLSAAEYSEILMVNKTAADLAVWANAAVATAFKGKTTTDISKTVLANVGLSTVPGLEAWLTGQLNGGGGFATAGATLLGLLDGYANMSATDPIYGASVVTFNTKVANSQTASQTAGTATGTYAAVSSLTPAAQAAADAAAKAAADKAAADAAAKAVADKVAADKAAADKAAADKIVADKAAADALAKEQAAATFTTGADNIVGTDGAITYTAVRSAISSENTLSGTDKLDGGAGTDTLAVNLKSSFDGFTTGGVKNVEIVTLTNTTDVARTFDATGVAGASTYNLDSKTGVSVINADTLGSVNVLNRASGTTTVDFDDTKISTTTDNSLNLGVSALGSGASTFVTVTAPDIQKMTVTSSGAASNVDLAGAPLKSLTIKGASDISVKATGVTTLTSIDASEATGKVTLAGLTGTVSSLKTGSADDKATVTAISTTAVLSGGLGNDSLVLSSLAAGTYQPAMTGFETLTVAGSAGAVVLSMAKSTDVANLVVDTLGGSLTMSKAGAGALSISSQGAQTANTISNDTTGNVSFTTVVADKVTSTTNDTDALSITASKTSALNIGVVKYTNATGTFTAPSASQVTLNAAGGFTGSIAAAKATDLSITASETVTLGAASDLSSVSTLNATTSKSLDLSNGGLTAVGSITAAGTGATSALTFGALGGATNTQAISLTATGWKGGTTLTTVDSQDAIKLDVTGTTGAVVIGAIGNATSTTPTGSITINGTGALGTITQTGTVQASASKSISVTAKDSIADVSFGNLVVSNSSNNLSGAITVDLSGSIANVSVGTMSAKSVTVDVSGGLNAVTPGNITSVTEVFTGNSSAANTRTDVANNLTYTGGSGVDTVGITHRDTSASTATNEETSVLNVSTGAGNDAVTFTQYAGQIKATYTGTVNLGENTGDADALTFNGVSTTTVLDLQGLTVIGQDSPVNINGVAAAALIYGTSGADSITGGTGVDTIFAGTGDDVIIVTLATDLDSGEILSGGFGTDTLYLPEAAAYDLTNLSSSYDNLVGEAGIENLIVKNTSVTLDEAISGTALKINTDGAVTLNMSIAMTATTLDLSKIVYSAIGDVSAATETALTATDDSFLVTGTAGADSIILSSLGDTVTPGTGVDTITAGGGVDTFVTTVGAAYTTATADTITGFTVGATGDILQIDISDSTAIANLGVLTAGNGATAIAGPLVIKAVTKGAGATTLAATDEILVLTGTYANAAAVIADLGATAGTTALSWSAAPTQTNGLLVAWNDGTNTYISALSDADAGGTAAMENADMAMTTIVTLTGVLTAFNTANFVAVA